MSKTKIPIKKKRFMLKILSIVFCALSGTLVLFEFFLTLHDDWDDVNMGAVFVAPLFAAASLLLAMLNIVHYRTKSKEIIASLITVGMSALLFCYVMLYTSSVFLARA